MKATINKIINFSNVDGPGNRTAIFFQGCSFRCLYCHNPETIRRCNNCGECVSQCPAQALSNKYGIVEWDKSKCIDCDTCIHVCRHFSSPKVEVLEVDELIDRIRPIKPFIRGITVSGGECMLHAEFLTELFPKVQEMGLTCLIDSNGSIDFSKHPKLLEVCDGVMLDAKAYDNEFHEALCGRNNDRVLQNIKYLLSINKLAEVRTVLLPNYLEENEETVREISKIIQDKCLYKLQKYRPFGVKEEALDQMGRGIMDDTECERLKEIAIANGAIHTSIR